MMVVLGGLLRGEERLQRSGFVVFVFFLVHSEATP
jgi:hypothetical protein